MADGTVVKERLKTPEDNKLSARHNQKSTERDKLITSLLNLILFSGMVYEIRVKALLKKMQFKSAFPE